MIKITRQGENFSPPEFTRELKLIDSGLYPLWDRDCERWLIASSGPADVLGKKEVVIEMAVSKGKAYTPLDRRILSKARKIFWAKNMLVNIDNHLKEMKESDEEMPKEAEKEWQGLKREFMKKLYRFHTTETFT